MLHVFASIHENTAEIQACYLGECALDLYRSTKRKDINSDDQNHALEEFWESEEYLLLKREAICRYFPAIYTYISENGEPFQRVDLKIIEPEVSSIQ